RAYASPFSRLLNPCLSNCVRTYRLLICSKHRAQAHEPTLAALAPFGSLGALARSFKRLRFRIPLPPAESRANYWFLSGGSWPLDAAGLSADTARIRRTIGTRLRPVRRAQGPRRLLRPTR